MKKALSLLLVLALLAVSSLSVFSDAIAFAASDNTESDYSTEIVVVGSGIAGLTAALAASQAGADVIVVEKQGYIGGGIVTSP